MHYLKIKRLISIAVFSIFLGCSHSSHTSALHPEKTTFDPQKHYSSDLSATLKKEIVLDRTQVEKALARADAPLRIRMVEVFSGTKLSRRYRVMGFDKTGIYPLLGLKVGDVILAADNFIIQDPALFPKFIGLLPNESAATIHVFRAGKELLLVYSIT